MAFSAIRRDIPRCELLPVIIRVTIATAIVPQWVCQFGLVAGTAIYRQMPVNQGIFSLVMVEVADPLYGVE